MRSVAVLACAMLAGCATTRTEIVPQVVERRVTVPASLLQCMPEPQAAETWRSQREVALYLVRLAEAGADCRTRLEAVKRVMESKL